MFFIVTSLIIWHIISLVLLLHLNLGLYMEDMWITAYVINSGYLIPENYINKLSLSVIFLPLWHFFFLSYFKRGRTQVTDSQPCSTTISAQPWVTSSSARFSTLWFWEALLCSKTFAAYFMLFRLQRLHLAHISPTYTVVPCTVSFGACMHVECWVNWTSCVSPPKKNH